MKNQDNKENFDNTSRNKAASRKHSKVVRVLLLPAVLLVWIVGWTLYWLE